MRGVTSWGIIIMSQEINVCFFFVRSGLVLVIFVFLKISISFRLNAIYYKMFSDNLDFTLKFRCSKGI